MREEYRQRGVFDARGEWTWSQWCCCLSDLTEEKDGEKDEMKGGRRRERERDRESVGKGAGQEHLAERFRHRDYAALYLVTMDEKHGFAQLARTLLFLDLLYCRG